jgi:gliding motility-associated protein GldM
MAGISSNPNSPRQKMINLMYLVFIAMMALNISSEVLDGFELVERSLRVSNDNSSSRNDGIIKAFERANLVNPEKTAEWYAKGLDVKKSSDDLYKYIDELKLRIVQETDGDEGDVNNIDHKDDLEAASRIMLAPVVGEGKKLKEKIVKYRTDMSGLTNDPIKKELFESVLTTEAPKKAGIISASWESALFENMPVAAAITLLTKIQSDVRFVEGEVLSTLLSNIDEGDTRVNKFDAFAIPESQVVTSGTSFRARLVLFAVDSTKQPEYYLGDRLLANNEISIPTGKVGEFPVAGKIVLDGNTYPYSTKYSVTESSATIAPVLMNFLYESIDMDIEIAIPGVASGLVRARIEGSGSIVEKERNIWTVRGLDKSKSPTARIILEATVGGQKITESKEFTVRELPPPLPFIEYKDTNGNTRKFKGGAISKRYLVETPGIKAAIDDGILNVPHQVTGFTLTVVDAMGNYIPEVSNSSEFTQRQKDLIRNLARGKRFYIGTVKALDPAGKPKNVEYSMEVIVN